MVKYEQKSYSIRWAINGDEVGGGYYTYDTLEEAQKGMKELIEDNDTIIGVLDFSQDFEIYDNENGIMIPYEL